MYLIGLQNITKEIVVISFYLKNIQYNKII